MQSTKYSQKNKIKLTSLSYRTWKTLKKFWIEEEKKPNLKNFLTPSKSVNQRKIPDINRILETSTTNELNPVAFS